MINWLKDIVIFFFWTYREFKELRKDYKVKDAKCAFDYEVEKFINKEKEKENEK